MTLRTLILRKLSDGRPTTAVAMARLWGEDTRRCEEWLEKFARIGVVRALRPGATGRRTTAYRPLRRAVLAELARMP